MNGRAQALAALHRAYAAFRKEVEPGGTEAAEPSIRAAAVVAGAYASAVTMPQLGLGGARLLSKSVTGGMRMIAVAGSRGAHQRRIRRSSQELAATLGALGDALERELRMFDARAEVLVREKIEVHRALLQSGVVSGSEALRPVADSLRLTLSRDVDTTLSRSPQARLAVQAALEASERAQIRSSRRPIEKRGRLIAAAPDIGGVSYAQRSTPPVCPLADRDGRLGPDLRRLAFHLP